MKKLGKNLAQLMKQKGKIGEKTVLMLGVRMVRLDQWMVCVCVCVCGRGTTRMPAACG